MYMYRLTLIVSIGTNKTLSHDAFTATGLHCFKGQMIHRAKIERNPD